MNTKSLVFIQKLNATMQMKILNFLMQYNSFN